MKSFLGTKFQLAILGGAPVQSNLRENDTSPIEWLFCKQTGDSLFDFYKDNAIVSSVNLEQGRFDLPNLLGIIVIGSADALDAIKSKWTSKLPAAALVFKQIYEGESRAILGAALECIADVLTSQRQYSGRAALELATYRREFERLQHNFVRVEEFVGRQHFQHPTEIFEYPADAMTATEGSGGTRLENVAGTTGRSLTQYLPLDSLGLSGFSIHISAKPDAAAPPLRVNLKAVETGHVFGTWSISTGEAHVGWIELSLDYAIDEPALSLVIGVEWPRTGGWALALGPPHPYKEFCARTEAGEHLSAPLALRVFSSLPGVRVTATTSAIRVMNASRVATEFIPYEVYQSVTQVSPPDQAGKPTLVSYDREIGCITVHPGGSGATIARLNIAVPKHAWGLSAQIHLGHERASLTQFGVVACPSRDESKELARLDHLDAPSQTFSGWKTLAALEWKSITLLLAPSREERLSVYLVTRQAPQLSPDFAWARFSKLQFNILPTSLIAENEAETVPVAAEMASIKQPRGSS
jgi:hypothetical protein